MRSFAPISGCLLLAAAAAAYDFKDDVGLAVHVEDNPSRIVCISPGATEIIFALGAQDRLVAVSEFCDFPPAARKLPRVGDFANPSMEAILSHDPDLIVTTGGLQRELVIRLRAAGMPAMVLYPKGMEGVFSNIELLGCVLGRQKQARRLNSRLKARVKRLVEGARARARAGERPPVIYLEISPQPFMAAGESSYAGELIRLAGGRNAAGGTRSGDYPIVSAETIIAANPDVIVLSHCDDPKSAREHVARRPGWGSLNAVRSGRVHADLDMDVLLRPGPRLDAGLAEIIRVLYVNP